MDLDLFSLLLFLIFVVFPLLGRARPGPRAPRDRPPARTPEPGRPAVPGTPRGPVAFPIPGLEELLRESEDLSQPPAPEPAARRDAPGEGTPGGEGGVRSLEPVAPADALGTAIEAEAGDVRAEAERIAREAEAIGALAAGPGERPPRRPPEPRARRARTFGGREDLARAVLLREVLGPPRALEPPRRPPVPGGPRRSGRPAGGDGRGT
ncbi:hypothetical protein [Caldinitratiruptor microaerophilus]|uniref:Uncharacterized protein n=1 Tax=Caldinitratiruptor microaerophilus TaxID=671077 RepID=A0AA35CLH8_9FIRM|nr:hypothetical protein [Caldinitratiruptor microaerophilus]BDG61412.1 hypothetical protein caldi_25020 [Caldinitratiruptor microaerophilus]